MPTKAELLERAIELNIEDRYQMTKAELQDAIEEGKVEEGVKDALPVEVEDVIEEIEEAEEAEEAGSISVYQGDDDLWYYAAGEFGYPKVRHAVQAAQRVYPGLEIRY